MAQKHRLACLAFGRTWVLVGHAVIGFALPLLSFAHAWSSMKLPGTRGTSTAGLWMATVALLLLVLQAMVGMTMLRLSEPQRIGFRRLHLAVAIVLVVRPGRPCGFEHLIERRTMKTTIVVLVICLASLAVFAAKHTDFSGTWTFNPEKGKNIGMMSEMKMTQTIEQSSSSLDVTSDTTFQSNNQQMKTHYDLSGKPATNDSPMAGPSETVSKWDGDKLVTTWTSKGAVAGTKTVRTENRSLSPDGRTMTVESVRGSNPPVVMVFDKK